MREDYYIKLLSLGNVYRVVVSQQTTSQSQTVHTVVHYEKRKIFVRNKCIF